jgi:hypothetical protein
LIKGEHIMANLTAVAQVYDNSGNAIAASQLGANNYKHVINQADVGRELIVKVSGNAGMLNVELDAAIQYITTSHGSSGSGDSAFVVAAVGTADGTAFVSGTTTDVFLRVQGTGALTVASVKAAAEGATGGNATTFTVTIPAIFTPAK